MIIMALSRHMSMGFRLLRLSVASSTAGRRWVRCSSVFSRSIDTTEDYGEVKTDIDKWVKQQRTDPDRYQCIEQREDRSAMSFEALLTHFKTGRYKLVHRGIPLMKGPDDMAVFYQLLWYLKPATIIEIGAYTGGFTLWMSDNLQALPNKCQLYSMDIDLSNLHPNVKQHKPENVHFVQGDSFAVEKTFTPEIMSQLQHPMVIIEDAHINVAPLLTYFHQFLQEGDYLVVEDTNPNLPTVSGMGSVYEEYVPCGRDKLDQLHSFLTEHKRWYSVDSFYTDFFGYNGTCNWHGIIRKMM